MIKSSSFRFRDVKNLNINGMALDQHRLLKKLAIKDYINKSETLPRAMKGEIARLNKILDGLQRNGTG